MLAESDTSIWLFSTTVLSAKKKNAQRLWKHTHNVKMLRIETDSYVGKSLEMSLTS